MQQVEPVVEERLFVGGRWIEGGGWLEVMNPATEAGFGIVTTSNGRAHEAAVIAARHAFDDGPWPRLRPVERAAALERLALALDARRDEFARRIVGEVGCPVAQVAGMQVRRPLEHWHDIAEMAGMSDEHPVTPMSNLTAGLVVEEPLGVVAAIAAYNYPLMLMTWKVGPALAAGCTVVLKPSELTPLTAFELARAAEEADLPPGVLNLVIGDGRAGAALVADPRVDGVTFTGSTAVGIGIMQMSAATLKRLVLELGGKSPAVVLDDADIASLVPKVVFGCMINAGQSCAATTRLIVSKDRYDEVVSAVVAAVERLTVGDPNDPSTDVGPLVTAVHRARVEAIIASVEAEGGNLLTGGMRPPLVPGHYLVPTVVADLPSDATAVREEIFGPVLVVQRAADTDDAVSIANNSPYGLAAVVYGHDRRRAMEVARRVRAGTVGINGGAFNPYAPYGGFKLSGLGRECGPWGIRAFRELKHVSW